MTAVSSGPPWVTLPRMRPVRRAVRRGTARAELGGMDNLSLSMPRLSTLPLSPRTERSPAMRALRQLLCHADQSAAAWPARERPRLLAAIHHILQLARLAAQPFTHEPERSQLLRGAWTELRRFETRLRRASALPAGSPLERAIDRADILLGHLADA